jgi:hypothetical protein
MPLLSWTGRITVSKYASGGGEEWEEEVKM